MAISLEEHQHYWEESNIQYGLCLCGCGEETSLATRSKGDQMLQGQPLRFKKGHSHGRYQGRTLDQKLLECADCLEVKPSAEFYVNYKTRIPTYRRACKVCWRKRSLVQSRKEISRRTAKNWRLQNTYNINLDVYDKMYAEQDGKCFICGEHKEVLFVDHNHATGKVRKLLCHNCNSILGLSYESIDILKEAIDYLEREEHVCP